MSYIEVSGRCKTEFKLLAQKVAEKVIELMNFSNDLEVAIDFVSENEIQRLNREFRNIDKVTDVLSFPSFSLLAGEILNTNDDNVIPFKQENGLYHFGEMAICLKQCERQAKEFVVTTESEIKKLVIHSMLHLMGYDHIKDEDYAVMKPQEEKLDKLIQLN